MENIEAMLCAYIEGDLDASGRAEIEKHLRDHPQHRQLIDELIATRDLVRSLPRVHAPAEVDDGLRGQTERSILLHDQRETATPSRLRINRWPQLAAVAAVFVLTGGLAIVVVKTVLPTFQPPKFTAVNMSGQPPAIDHDQAAQRAEDRSAEIFASTDPANRAMAMTAHRDGTILPAGPAVPQQLNMADVQRVLSDSGFAGANGEHAAAMYLVVNSQDPSSTNDKIARFLNSNGITWMPIPESGQGASTLPSTLPSTLRQSEAEAQKKQNPFGELTTMPSTVPSDKLVDRDASPTVPAGAVNSDAATQPDISSTTLPAMLPTAPQPIFPPAIIDPVADQSGAATLPSVTPGMMPALEKNDLTRATTQPSQSAPNSIQSMYVARQMTRKQANELRKALGDDQNEPVVMIDGSDVAPSGVVNLNGIGPATQPGDVAPDNNQPSGIAGQGQVQLQITGTPMPAVPAGAPQVVGATSQPSDTPLHAGDQLILKTDNFTLGGDQKDSAATLLVDNDGTVNVPGVGRVAVAGLSLEQAHSAIVKACQDAHLSSDPQLHLDKRGAMRMQIQIKPGVQHVVIQQGANGNQPVDVVIVIQNATVTQTGVIKSEPPATQATPSTLP